METVGRLAKRYGLSRSTLLYYEKRGVLRPSGRSEGGYRLYTEEDERRLERLLVFREAGVPLDAAGRLLDGPENRESGEILERHLRSLNAQAREIRRRQGEVCTLLGGPGQGTVPDRTMWEAVFAGAGLSRDVRQAWHREFERRYPEAHHGFLASLGFSESEIILKRKGGLPVDAGEKSVRVFFEAYEGMIHLGPGGAPWTLQALEQGGALPPEPEILDVGCGAGVATVLLAEHTGGRVTALDLHPDFLGPLAQRARDRGVASRVIPVVGDMGDMPFEAARFDLLWSEGAIYIIGFDRGIRTWKPFLRPGGVLAVSDMVLLEDPLPEEPRAFWAQENLFLRRPEAHLAALAAEGYQDGRFFLLPPEAWMESYYLPLERNLVGLRLRYRGDDEALGVLEMLQREIDLYRKWGHTYTYAFFTARRGA